MEKYLKNLNFWLNNNYIDEDTKKELLELKENLKEIEDRFYKELDFGTAGLRGIIGSGTNRMNIYTVRKASQGLSDYITKKGPSYIKRGIVIAYDSRHKSDEFALEAAKVFAGNGIKAYLFDELRPVPVLSFAVRHLNAAAGIVITASHNPKEYNGYKVYGEDGAQLGIDDSNDLIVHVISITDFSTIKIIEKDQAINSNLINIIGKEIDDIYTTNLKTLCINPECINQVADSFKIVYTPLHGTGNKPVRRILREVGFKNILVVKEQELPDPDFPTVRLPNPEEKDSFKIAIELAKDEDVDLIIGTDPDCDRMGVVVRATDGEYIVLTGNQIGCLIMEYILSQKKEKGILPSNGFVVKTVVSTELARTIAESYNIELIEVLTGFKFIGEKIRQLDEFGDKKYLFGFEESFGYLAGTFSRDKDAVVASMLIAEMAAFYKTKGMSLYDGLLEIYKKYGFSIEEVDSFTLSGKEGLEKIKSAMKFLRENQDKDFPGFKVRAIRDYLYKLKLNFQNHIKEAIDLPASDVLYYEIQDGSWFCIRPSGTEPKLKVYFGVTSISEEAAKKKMNALKDSVLSVVKPLLV